MYNNKNILSEIYRIQELMSLEKKPLLSESILSVAARDLFERSLGLFEKGLLKGLPKITREVFENRMSTIVNRLENNLPLSPVERDFFSKIVSKVFPTLIGDAYNRTLIPLIQDLVQKNPELIELGVENFERIISNKKFTDNEIVNALYDSYSPYIQGLTKDDLSAFRKLKTGQLGEGSVVKIPKARKTTTDVISKVDEPIPTELKVDEPIPTELRVDEPTPTDTEIDVDINSDSAQNEIDNFLSKKYSDIPPLTKNQITKLIRLNEGFAYSLRQLRQQIKDWMTSNSKLMDEVIQLSANYSKLEPKEQVNVMKRINDLITQISKSDIRQFKYLQAWIDKEIRPYDLNLSINLKNEDAYKMAVALSNDTTMKEYIEKYGSLMSRRSKMWIQLNKVINPASWLPKRMKKYSKGGAVDSYWTNVGDKWKNIFKDDEFRELRAYFLTGQSKNTDALAEYYKKFGGKKLATSVLKEWGYTYLATVAILANLRLIRDFLGFIISDSELTKDLNWVKKAKADLEKIGVKVDFGENVPFNILETIIMGIGNEGLYLFDEAKYLRFKLPGIAANLADLFSELRNNPATKAGVTGALNTVNNAITVTEAEVNRLDTTIRTEVQQFRDERLPSSFTADEPEGVAIKWAKDPQGGDMIDVESITEVPGSNKRKFRIKEKNSTFQVEVTLTEDGKDICDREDCIKIVSR